jgi:hypothetical protein
VCTSSLIDNNCHHSTKQCLAIRVHSMDNYGQYRHIWFLSLFHPRWTSTAVGKPPTCPMTNLIVNVIFKRFSKPFEEIFLFYPFFLGMIDNSRLTSVDEQHYQSYGGHNDRSSNAVPTVNDDSSINASNGICITCKMVRRDDESLKHSSLLPSTRIIVNDMPLTEYIRTSFSLISL